MTPAAALAALRLPAAALVGEAVPKQAILDRLKPAADRRLARERLRKLVFVARLTPLSCAIPAGDGADALTVALATVDAPTPAPGLPKLLHRLVPHPMLLLEQSPPTGGGDAELLRLTARGVRCVLPTAHAADLLAALAPSGVSGGDVDLSAVLRRWRLAVATADAAALTGVFAWDPSADPDALAADCAELRGLDATIRGLQGKARREKQPGVRAELNAGLREARGRQASLLDRLR